MNICVFCDGTWQDADSQTDGTPTPSNVVKLYNALADQDQAGQKQSAYYHPGVGSRGGFVSRALGGAVGLGLRDDVKSGYKWLATKYSEGDNIFLFGFSRGAFTVRSIAGMINTCGLLDLTDTNLSDETVWARVDQAFDVYRKKAEIDTLKGWPSFHTGPGENPAGATPVHCLGVWDTVGALGVPDGLALLNFFDNPKTYEFHNTSLGQNVQNAFHAIAIDEWREAFAPTLWTGSAPATSVEQKYFVGNHGDVGGGWIEAGLSDLALEWMMDKAEGCGLVLEGHARSQLKPDFSGVIHDAVTGVFKKLKTRPRYIPDVDNAANASRFHPSVPQRRDHPPITQGKYLKTSVLASTGDDASVRIYAQEKWNETGIFLDKSQRYELTAQGEWLDGKIRLDPAGDRKNFHISQLLHFAGSGIGAVEGLIQRFQPSAELHWVTKRVEDYPWFALVGVVANAAGASTSSGPTQHQSFLIGNRCTIGPGSEIELTDSGYLFCYANDAWSFYDNNKGSVRLNAKRL